MIGEQILSLAERGDFRTAALASMRGQFRWGDLMGALAMRAEARKRGVPLPSASGSGTRETPATMTPHEFEAWRGRTAAAYHESGHSVVILALGHRLHAAVVRGPNDGEVTFTADLCRSVRHPLDEVAISWAGPLAQNWHCRGSYEDDVRRLSDSDAEPIRLVARRVDQDYPRAWDAASSPASLQGREIARAIIAKHWHSVVTVACALLQRGSLTGAEIRELIPSVVNVCV